MARGPQDRTPTPGGAEAPRDLTLAGCSGGEGEKGAGWLLRMGRLPPPTPGQPSAEWVSAGWGGGWWEGGSRSKGGIC